MCDNIWCTTAYNLLNIRRFKLSVLLRQCAESGCMTERLCSIVDRGVELFHTPNQDVEGDPLIRSGPMTSNPITVRRIDTVLIASANHRNDLDSSSRLSSHYYSTRSSARQSSLVNKHAVTARNQAMYSRCEFCGMPAAQRLTRPQFHVHA